MLPGGTMPMLINGPDENPFDPGQVDSNPLTFTDNLFLYSSSTEQSLNDL